jgi:hypothetical protein
VDEPQGFPSSVSPLADVTGPLAYLRFHGCNVATWEGNVARTSVDRLDWYYSEEELQE